MMAARTRVVNDERRSPFAMNSDASATNVHRTRWNAARRAPPPPAAVHGRTAANKMPISRISTRAPCVNMTKLTVSVDSGCRDPRARYGGPNSCGEECDTPSSASSSPATDSVPNARTLRPCPPLPPPPNLRHRASVDSDADSGIGHHRVSTSSSEGDHPLKRAVVSSEEWVPIRGPSGCLGIHPASAVRNLPHSDRWRPTKIPPPPKDYMLPPSLSSHRDGSRFARWSVTGATSSSSSSGPKGNEGNDKKRWSAPAIGRLSVSSLYANVYENTMPQDAQPTKCPKAMCASLASLLSVEDMPRVHARPVAVVPANETGGPRKESSSRSEAEYARVNKPRGLARKTVNAHPGDDRQPPLPPRNYRSGTPVRRSQSLSRRSIASRVQVLTRTAKMALRKAFSLDALGSAAALKKDPPPSSSSSRSFF